MFDQLFQTFAQSRQGQSAYQQLQSQGYTPQQAAGMLGAAFPVAAQSMQRAAANPAGLGLTDITSGHYATNFLTAAVTGFLKGDGFVGAAMDGLQGVIGGHVAEVIASRFGLPQRTAGMAGAVVTPFIVDFLAEKLQGMNLSGAPQAAPAYGGGIGAQGGFGAVGNPFGNR